MCQNVFNFIERKIVLIQFILSPIHFPCHANIFQILIFYVYKTLSHTYKNAHNRPQTHAVALSSVKPYIFTINMKNMLKNYVTKVESINI